MNAPCCPRCETNGDEKALNCLVCGYNYAQTPQHKTTLTYSPQGNPPSLTKPRRHSLHVFSIFVALMLLAYGIYYYVNSQ